LRLYFVRHGESEANQLHVISNRDLPHGLTAKGREQSCILADRFGGCGITQIFTSPLLRARQTAEILAHAWNLDMTVADALQEYDCGLIEGRLDDASGQLHRQLRSDWLNYGLWERRIEQGESFYRSNRSAF